LTSAAKSLLQEMIQSSRDGALIAVKLDKISYTYVSQPVFTDLSWDIHDDRIVGLIGPNGCGKTTFIRAVSGVLPLQSGVVKMQGHDVTRLTPQQRARMVSVVPQARSIPAAFTAEEVVAMGRTPHLNWLGRISSHDQAVIDNALEMMDLLHLRERTVNELSGGEQQRLFWRARWPRNLLCC